MSKPLFSNLARKKLNFWRFRFSVKNLNLTASFHKLLKLHFLLSFTRNILVTSLLTHNTCIQDFWGLEACNGFGDFGERWVQNPFLSIWSGLAAIGIRFAVFRKILRNLTKSFKSYLPPFLTWKQILYSVVVLFNAEMLYQLLLNCVGPQGVS